MRKDFSKPSDYKAPSAKEQLAWRIESQLKAGVQHVLFVGAELNILLDALKDDTK